MCPCDSGIIVVCEMPPHWLSPERKVAMDQTKGTL